MASRRHQHPPTARAEALSRIRAGAVPTDVARDLGLPARTVRRWATATPASRPPSPPPSPATDPQADAPPAPPPTLHVLAGGAEVGAEAFADLVESLLLSGRWRRREVRALARKLGRTLEEVEAERDGLLDETVGEMTAPARRRAELVLQARDLLALAKHERDIGGAVRALSVLARLMGLDSLDVRVEHSGRVEHGLSPDELLERRRATWERLRELGAGEELDS